MATYEIEADGENAARDKVADRMSLDLEPVNTEFSHILDDPSIAIDWPVEEIKDGAK